MSHLKVAVLEDSSNIFDQFSKSTYPNANVHFLTSSTTKKEIEDIFKDLDLLFINSVLKNKEFLLELDSFLSMAKNNNVSTMAVFLKPFNSEPEENKSIFKLNLEKYSSCIQSYLILDPSKMEASEKDKLLGIHDVFENISLNSFSPLKNILLLNSPNSILDIEFKDIKKSIESGHSLFSSEKSGEIDFVIKEIFKNHPGPNESDNKTYFVSVSTEKSFHPDSIDGIIKILLDEIGDGKDLFFNISNNDSLNTGEIDLNILGLKSSF